MFLQTTERHKLQPSIKCWGVSNACGHGYWASRYFWKKYPMLPQALYWRLPKPGDSLYARLQASESECPSVFSAYAAWQSVSARILGRCEITRVDELPIKICFLKDTAVVFPNGRYEKGFRVMQVRDSKPHVVGNRSCVFSWLQFIANV